MKLAIILAFLFYGNAHISEIKDPEPCKDFKIESKIKNTTNSLANGEVEILASGGTTPYKYIFFNEKGHPLSLNNDSKTLKNREVGTFFCTVLDKAGCQKKIKIEIK